MNGESDGLPGLVVDRYADVLVAQFLAAGVERWRDPILDALTEISGCEAIFERSDAEVRKLEGLEPRVGFARGNRNATRCPIIEYGLNFRVDVEQGQKTGFFLDQRENRQRVRALAAGREVLDGFCYTGGFSISALAGGAKRVTAIESSAPALEVAKENLAANPLDASKVEFVQADVFSRLRTLRDQNAKFDLIILDPPKFAPTAAQVQECGARLQGHQPLGAQAARARRHARHLLLLRRGAAGAVPVDRRRRGARCRRRRRRSSSASARPPTIRWRSSFRKGNTSRGCCC